MSYQLCKILAPFDQQVAEAKDDLDPLIGAHARPRHGCECLVGGSDRTIDIRFAPVWNGGEHLLAPRRDDRESAPTPANLFPETSIHSST